MARSLFRSPSASLMLLSLVVATGCKKCGNDDDDTPPDVVTPPVIETIQVSGNSPSTAAPNTDLSVTVYGAGFKAGDAIRLRGDDGAVRTADATVESSDRLSFTFPGSAEGSYALTVTRGATTSNERTRAITVLAAVDKSGACPAATVYFDTNVFALSADAKGTLDQAAPCYAGSSATINLGGHADPRGTTEYNQTLSEKRANAAKSYLATQSVPAERMNAQGFGETAPVDDGNDEAAWAKNRRVEVSNTK